MGRYILRRMLWVLVTLALISFITFALFSLLPAADPALVRAGRHPTPELVERVRRSLGLDRPWLEQYVSYVDRLVLHLDLGRSFFTGVPVRDELLSRLPATAYLAGGALLVAVAVGVPVGVASAVRRGSRVARAATAFTVVGVCAPVYWLGLLSLYVFSRDGHLLRLLPGQGTCVTFDPVSCAPSYVLPWLVLGIGLGAFYARMLQATMLDTLSAPYIRTARAKGLSERRVAVRHALPIAVQPMVSMVGLDLGFLLGGAVLVEAVFNLPGLGRYVAEAVRRSDLAAVEGTVLVAALFICLLTFAVDLFFAVVDPRVRQSIAARAPRVRPRTRQAPTSEPIGNGERADEALVVVERLTKCFSLRRVAGGPPGEVRAVDGVSFTIREGKTLAIIGESGCGKSTLARLVVRLLDPTSGRIFFGGEDITNLSGRLLRRFRRGAQMVFQDPLASANPRHTIGRIVSTPLRTQKVPGDHHQMTEDLLERVGLSAEDYRRYPAELSGGQLQRVSIARALALQPKLIVLDEPVSALDASVRAQVVALLRDLQFDLRLTYLLVSHDLSVVRAVSDRVAVMYLGRLVEVGERDDIYNRPLHPYTQLLLSALPAAERPSDSPSLADEAISLSAPTSGCRFRPRCPIAQPICDDVEPFPEHRGAAGDHAVACHFPIGL